MRRIVNNSIICGVFLCFEAVLGLKINLTKSKLVHVGGVEVLAHILGCRVSSLLM